MKFKYKVKSRMCAAKNVPKIHLVTMPKTGTQTIRNILIESLKIPRRHIHNGQFPHEQLGNDAKINSRYESYISASHWAPNRHNCVVASNSGQKKVIVNIRDPRQATLSWAYHVERLRNNRHPDFSEIDLCPDWYHSGVGQVDALADLNFYIDNYFPILVSWLKSWEALTFEDSGLEVKILTFEKFKTDPHQYFYELLEFFGCDVEIAHRCANHKLVEGKIGKSHFRRGLVDEWKTAFSAEQIKFCNDYMSSLNLANYNYEI